jgi:hypothetical protein
MVRDFYKYSNIKTATTTVVKSVPGALIALIVNGGTLGSITLYDNTAGEGTEIAIIASPTAGMVLPYSAKLSTGLTVVTAAATNITVIYL